MEELTNRLKTIFQLKDDELKALLNLFSAEQFDKHQYFAKNGTYAQQMAFVGEGILRAYFQNDKGEEYNKTFFKKGDFLGAYSSLVSGRVNLIDIQCLTNCVLYTASYPSFVQLFDTYPKIERIARITAEQFFVNKEKREIELVTLEAKDRYRIFQEEHPGLELLIPQYHIASYLGVSPTQLSRIRAQKNLK